MRTRTQTSFQLRLPDLFGNTLKTCKTEHAKIKWCTIIISNFIFALFHQNLTFSGLLFLYKTTLRHEKKSTTNRCQEKKSASISEYVHPMLRM